MKRYCRAPSPPDKGTPVIPAPATAALSPVPTGFVQAAPPASSILLVEDQSLVAMLLEDVLADAGHSVVVTGNAEDALVAWRTAEREGRPFRALVTDLGLPADRGSFGGGPLGGIELVRSLRALRRALPVIVVTGRSIDEDELRTCLGARDAGRRGETRILAKPFDLDALPEALANAIEVARPRRPRR